MFCLSARCAQNNTNLDKLLFILCNYASINAVAARRSRDIRNFTMNKNFATTRKQNMSRYSANTIVPHFKDFRMMDYDIIGFDLDGTLLRYELNNMVLLEHELLKKFLVGEKNYPAELLNKKFESNFLQKGLIIDSDRGNILKLSENGIILKAAHGTKFMSVDEICKVYGDLRKWDTAEEYLKDPLSAWNGPIADKLRTLLDYFDIGAALVFAQAVDIIDKTSSSKYTLDKNDYKIWLDIKAGLIKLYSREHFATGESAYFEAIKEKPDKYLLKTDFKVIELLKHLKSSGKALYLLTGSNVDFANFTASYAMGQKWYDFFDYTIVFAKKPGFFFAQRQFLKTGGFNEIEGSEIPLKEILKPNTCYSQGNWQQLKESISTSILHKNPKGLRSLYVGDNLIQDIYAPNITASIDTLALSEELLENDKNYNFKSIVQSSLWGSYFYYDGTPTLWSKFIEKYSQLCVSHIDILAQISPEEKIHCKNKEGYFPELPQVL